MLPDCPSGLPTESSYSKFVCKTCCEFLPLADFLGAEQRRYKCRKHWNEYMRLFRAAKKGKCIKSPVLEKDTAAPVVSPPELVPCSSETSAAPSVSRATQ